MNPSAAQMQLELEEAMYGKYLIFNIGHEEYGIEICYVTEIIGIQDITAVPEMPDHIKGIINLRGTIIPVIDIRTRFNRDTTNYNDRTCIIVVDINDMTVGVIVDAVQEVADIDDEAIVKPPTSQSGMGSQYIKNIGKRGDKTILLVDSFRLFDADEIALLESM